MLQLAAAADRSQGQGGSSRCAQGLPSRFRGRPTAYCAVTLMILTRHRSPAGHRAQRPQSHRPSPRPGPAAKDPPPARPIPCFFRSSSYPSYKRSRDKPGSHAVLFRAAKIQRQIIEIHIQGLFHFCRFHNVHVNDAVVLDTHNTIADIAIQQLHGAIRHLHGIAAVANSGSRRAAYAPARKP